MRMREMMGDSYDCLVLRNLFDVPQPRNGKGSRFPVVEGVRRARGVRFRTPVVLFAGHRVARAFRFKARYFDPVLFRERHLAYVIPHPSGVNTWWNNEFSVARAARELALIYHASKCEHCELEYRVRARTAGRIVR